MSGPMDNNKKSGSVNETGNAVKQESSRNIEPMTLVQIRQIGPDAIFIDIDQSPAVPGQPAGKQGEVAAVGGKGVLRQAVLQPEGVAKLVEQRGVSLVHEC